MNQLPTHKRTQLLTLLVEGISMSAAQRVVGIQPYSYQQTYAPRMPLFAGLSRVDENLGSALSVSVSACRCLMSLPPRPVPVLPVRVRVGRGPERQARGAVRDPPRCRQFPDLTLDTSSTTTRSNTANPSGSSSSRSRANTVVGAAIAGLRTAFVLPIGCTPAWPPGHRWKRNVQKL